METSCSLSPHKVRIGIVKTESALVYLPQCTAYNWKKFCYRFRRDLRLV